MADNDYTNPFGLTTRAITPAHQASPIGNRNYVAPTQDNAQGSQHTPTQLPDDIDGFALENVTPEAANALLATDLMSLPESDMQKTRLGMLRTPLQKIGIGAELANADREALMLASSIIRSAPRMIAARMSHDNGEYRQEEIRSFVQHFIDTADRLRVIAYKQGVIA